MSGQFTQVSTPGAAHTSTGTRCLLAAVALLLVGIPGGQVLVGATLPLLVVLGVAVGILGVVLLLVGKVRQLDAR